MSITGVTRSDVDCKNINGDNKITGISEFDSFCRLCGFKVVTYIEHLKIMPPSTEVKNYYVSVMDLSFQSAKCDMNIWAATWQNQQSDCAPSEDSYQPGHPHSLIRVFAVRSMGS